MPVQMGRGADALAAARPTQAAGFLGIGVCGTLTTFSTMQLELFEMVDGGYLGLAAAYCAVTIAAGCLFLRLGIAAERWRVALVALCATKAPRREERDSQFPLGILVVNVSGALLLGLVAGATLSGQALVIAAGGGIGSFTTFSTWILDSHPLGAAL